MSKTKDLYTDKDIPEVRDLLLKEQKGLDPLTKTKVQNPCLDHLHDSECLVRGVLSRESNAFEGKVSGAFARYLRWWSDTSLPDVLRNLAEYYEKGTDSRFRHPKWKDEIIKKFKGLKVKQKEELLLKLGFDPSKNDTERLKKLNKALTRRYNISYDQFVDLINGVSDV